MRARALLLATTILAATPSAWAANGPPFRFAESAGPLPVGLKVVEQFDYSRVYRHTTDALGKPYPGERARPLQTLVWYPAESSHAKPMALDDYLNLQATETRFGESRTPAIVKHERVSMAPTLATPLRAVRDAPAAAGRFPVVVYAPSFSSVSWENADLCEYLASHGYVVIASPSMGTATRNMTKDLAGIDAQARDISFLLGYARSLPNADMTKVAVAGFSWGGIANLFAAARDNRIKALVALDGSMRYFPDLVVQAGDVHPQRMTIPLLYFAQGEVTLEYQARYLGSVHDMTANVLNAWTHGDLITVHMLGLTHQEFSSMFQREEDLWKDFYDKDFSDHEKADYGREDGIIGYGWVARYTLWFLDAYLKHDAAAASLLKKTPAENGVPRHFMAVSYREAKGRPASFDAFRAEIGRQGFGHTGDIYAAMHEQSPDFTLDEGMIDSWSDELIDDGHVPEAIRLLGLNVQMHPDSASAYAGLGEAYAQIGQGPSAIDSYQKALQKDPLNVDIRHRLEELEKPAKKDP
ncbi:MAG TPA: dienelactone hydrolase family protein [Steroidobacteraceae bacterium]|nr:dienelactone hydrolase family protein [Steroidobacteraceae bacterium]